MRKLIVVYQGVSQSAVLNNILSVSGVNDAITVTVIDAAIVDTAPGQEQQVKSQLNSLSAVTQVYEEIQAVPLIADKSELQSTLNALAVERGYEIPLPGDFPEFNAGNESPTDDESLESIDDSLDEIGVPDIHESGANGSGVVVANVDTGVYRSQFRSDRLLDGFDASNGDDPYEPTGGHGTYTMGIAAGDEETAGITRGPAYEASIFPIKVSFGSGGLIAAAEALQSLAQETDGPVVVNHSWGYNNCTGVCSRPETEAFVNAMQEPNAYHIWAAGNDARKCGGDCDNDSSNGINGPNSTDAAITVAATGRNGDLETLHYYSSRGPGSCGSEKPELSAPIYGVVPYGSGQKNIGNDGGTSGATPQVTGVVAATLSATGSSDSVEIKQPLNETATQIGDFESPRNNCTGHGNIAASSFFSGFNPQPGPQFPLPEDAIAYGSVITSLGITSVETGLYDP